MGKKIYLVSSKYAGARPEPEICFESEEDAKSWAKKNSDNNFYMVVSEIIYERLKNVDLPAS